MSWLGFWMMVSFAINIAFIAFYGIDVLSRTQKMVLIFLRWMMAEVLRLTESAFHLARLLVSFPIIAAQKLRFVRMTTEHWGLVLSGGWIAVFLLWHINRDAGGKSIFELGYNEFGDFLAGIFAPLAFVMLAISVIVQNRDFRLQLQANRKAELQRNKLLSEQSVRRRIENFAGYLADLKCRLQFSVAGRQRAYVFNFSDPEVATKIYAEAIKAICDNRIGGQFTQKCFTDGSIKKQYQMLGPIMEHLTFLGDEHIDQAHKYREIVELLDEFIGFAGYTDLQKKREVGRLCPAVPFK